MKWSSTLRDYFMGVNIGADKVCYKMYVNITLCIDTNVYTWIFTYNYIKFSFQKRKKILTCEVSFYLAESFLVDPGLSFESLWYYNVEARGILIYE